MPYTLVSTRTQFRSLVYGRQKAILVRTKDAYHTYCDSRQPIRQWARARALRAAYEQQCLDSPNEDGATDITLSNGDVFHWLEDEDLPPKRPEARTDDERTASLVAKRKQRPMEKREDGDSELYCRFCGLHYHLHPSAIAETQAISDASRVEGVKVEPTTQLIPSRSSALLTCSGFNSTSSMELPVVDVNGLSGFVSSWPLAKSPVSQTNDAKGSLVLSPQALAVAAEPDLIAFMASIILPPTTTSLMSKHRKEVEEHIAPAALLALVAKLLTKTLVRAGSDAYRRDEGELRGLGRTRTRKDVKLRRLLTPMHVLRGLLHDAPRVREAGALLLLLSPLGMSLPTLPMDADVSSR